MKKLSLFLVALTLMLVSCKPDPVLPTVTIMSVTDITTNAAAVVAEVEADGGAEVTERGFCWGVEQAPSVENDSVQVGKGVGEFMAEIKDLMPNTKYYVRAFAVNSAGVAYSDEMSFATELQTSGVLNGYEWVDLGLPSGLKWATMNVGATAPAEIGNYYAWGEIKAKDEFYADNSLTYGVPLGDFSGNPEYDVAAASWGETWRMPKESEVLELVANCTFEWTVIGITPGSLVTGPNGNHIFFPSGGFMPNATSIDFVDSEAAYWTSTQDTSNGDLGFATFMYIYNNNYAHRGWMCRYVGMPVRPVTE